MFFDKRDKKRKSNPTYEEQRRAHELKHGPISPINIAALDEAYKRRQSVRKARKPKPGAPKARNHAAAGLDRHGDADEDMGGDVEYGMGGDADDEYETPAYRATDEDMKVLQAGRHVNDLTKPSVELRQDLKDQQSSEARCTAAKAWRKLIFVHLNDVAYWATPLERPDAMCTLCSHPATYVCNTCNTFSAGAIFCSAHAISHAPYAHDIVDREDKILRRPAMRCLPCQCSTMTAVRAVPMKVYLHGYDASEMVAISCRQCSPAAVLLRLGFFPSSPFLPAHGFAFSMLQSGCAYRKAGNGVSYFGAAKVFFGERPEYEHDVKETIYRPFKHALCQYEKIKHFMTHGRVTEAIVTLFGPGKTDCYCAGPEVNLEDLGFELALINPPVVRVMDACFGYKRLKKQHGSGAAFTDARIGVDGKGLFMEPRMHQGSAKQPGRVCAVAFRAGEDSGARDSRCDVTGVFASGCRHGTVERVLDIDKGEKLCYATTVVDDLAKRYKGSKLCISYDIACKLVAHVAKHRKKAPDTVQPDIAVLPALHAYAHSNGCQSRFSTRSVMGVGTLDGEAIERIWSDGQANVSDTSRMRPENRRDTLALLFEYQAQRRACSFFADVTESVKKAIEDATVVAGRLRDIPTYESVVAANRKRRTEAAKQANVQDSSQDDASRNMEECARSLQRVTAALSSVRGSTKLTTCYIRQRDVLIDRLKQQIDAANAVDNGCTHTMKTVMDSITTLNGATLDARDHEKFWRLVEDVFHTCVDLSRSASSTKTCKKTLKEIKVQVSSTSADDAAGLARIISRAVARSRYRKEQAQKAVKLVKTLIDNAGYKCYVEEVIVAFNHCIDLGNTQ